MAFGVALFFSMHAFAVSGGILLFLIALPMLFGQRSSLQSAGGSEQPGGGEDVAIFPMAIPMLAGPGTIATVLVLATQAGRDVRRLLALAIVLACIYVLSWPILHASDRVTTTIGSSPAHPRERRAEARPTFARPPT